jgi:prepilin-type processing-associated H-X9-DG protein
MKSSNRTRSPGFSLTEILVVFVIIIVLAAIAMISTKALREKAGAAVCTQNLRQIGVGLHAYTAENNGRFPDGSADVSWLGKGMCWYDAAAQNMGRQYDFDNWRGDPLPSACGCPSGHGKAYWPSWPYTGDYAANWHLGNEVKTLSAVNNPAATPYVQDTVLQNNFAHWTFGLRDEKAKENISAFADRHAGRGNILWVDGHVSSFTYAEYMEYANKPSHGGAYGFVTGGR